MGRGGCSRWLQTRFTATSNTSIAQREETYFCVEVMIESNSFRHDGCKVYVKKVSKPILLVWPTESSFWRRIVPSLRGNLPLMSK